MNRDRVQAVVDATLHGADDGELYLEYRQTESFCLRRRPAEGRDLRHDAGLRPARGGGRSHRLRPRLGTCPKPRSSAPPRPSRVVKLGHSGALADGAAADQHPALHRRQPARLGELRREGEADGGDRRLCAARRIPRVRQVSCSLAGEWQVVEIMRPGGEIYRDVRPLVRLNVSVVVEEDGRQETGYLRRRRAARLHRLYLARLLARRRG